MKIGIASPEIKNHFRYTEDIVPTVIDHLTERLRVVASNLAIIGAKETDVDLTIHNKFENVYTQLDEVTDDTAIIIVEGYSVTAYYLNSECVVDFDLDVINFSGLQLLTYDIQEVASNYLNIIKHGYRSFDVTNLIGHSHLLDASYFNEDEYGAMIDKKVLPVLVITHIDDIETLQVPSVIIMPSLTQEEITC